MAKATLANQKGFTIIELLISMAAFSSMMMVASLTILQIGQAYFKGVNSINTQDATNLAFAAVTEQAQFGTGDIKQGTPEPFGPGGPTPDKINVLSRCIGSTRYSYVIDRRLSPSVDHNTINQQIRHVLWQDFNADGNCTPLDITKVNPSGTNSGTELLNENMRLKSFDISYVSPTDNTLVKVDIGVIYGDNDLVEGAGIGTPIGCFGSVVGSQWCAASHLTTQVSRRLTGN